MLYPEMETLETNRLLLRKFRMEDVPEVFANYASSDAVTRFMTWPTHASTDVTREYLQSVLKNYASGKSYEWAVVLKEPGETIGAVSIIRINEEDDSAEIGYCIGERFWNKGIMTEAAGAVLAFIREKMKPGRVLALHDINNPASGAVMRKCGMTFAKRQEGHRNNQGVCTVDVYELALGK